ncbi:MAG: hypothetical protein GF310_02015 [candidate division Zixibacteria bacterium]|nr:hypothetical protein [candidate division Zixibacteria bacterium]
MNLNLKKIQPAVVIGLGGTGVKTITFLKKILQEQAEDSAQFVRFLAIDIDELKGEVASASLFGNPIRLDPEKNEFFRIADQTRGSEARNIPSVSSWFPEEGYKYLPLTEGARQAKPIGRLGFFLSHDELTRRVYRLADKLVTPQVLETFPSIKAGELNVYVVSSICGGTGAGLFLDIAYELRYLQQQTQLPEKSRIKGLFALGDVYDAVSKRVLANTYASLRELNWIQKEDAAFHPVYPDGTRDVIRGRAFDAVYLFGDKNRSDIEISSPDDFAQLCAEFIFLDSGSDVQETGDPLSQMMQSNRNNAEVYTMNYDADGTPRSYSALGLCKIRFPIDRVAELCAARMSQDIIHYHIIGRLDHSEILEARRKVKEFITNEGLGCFDDSSDLPDRLVEKLQEGGDRIPLDNWVSKGLATAYNTDMENINKLEIRRLTTIVERLNSELKQFQNDMPDRLIGELQNFQGVLDREIKQMFQENLGVNFVVRFLEELLESAKKSEDYAQTQMRSLLEHEKRLSDEMNNQMRELDDLLGESFFGFLKKQARLAQLKDTYKAIRNYFIHRINIMKMRAAANFYNGVYDAKQRLVDGGEGAISRLSNMRQTIYLIQAFIENMAKTFKTAYEEKKKIEGSPFEILIYDNERFSTLTTIYDAVYSDALRERLFGNILQQIGGSIWNLQDYMDNEEPKLRDLFMQTCSPVFEEHINQKTVAQRILEAKTNVQNPIDYTARLQSAYGLSDYFCHLDDATSRFADLRDSEQSVVCVVGFVDEEDHAWNQVERTLREAIGRGGRQIPFTRTSDKHSILLYREFCGFPAYTLKRISAYHGSYVNEARRENTPPLQMLTKEQLDFINIPTTTVLSKFELMVVEALALGVIISDEEYYYMVLPNEFKRRREAEAKQARGESASVEDRLAGSHRRLGSKFTEVISMMKANLPPEARLSSIEVKWMDQVQQQIDQRKKQLEDQKQRDLLCDLYEVMYFDGYAGTKVEQINLENEIRPAIVFILKRDFALKEEHIRRPRDEETKQDLTHQQLLDRLYVGSEGKPPLIS